MNEIIQLPGRAVVYPPCLSFIKRPGTGGQPWNMKKSLLFLLFLLGAFMLPAQEAGEWKEASKESQAYHESRLKLTVPPYGLQKIKKLIAGTATDDEDNKKLSAKIYQSLSLREQFTYHMIHAESYSQNCDVMPPVQDEQKKIFARLPDAFGDYSWSDAQVKFFSAHRDSVISLIKESIGRTGRVGLNYKQALAALNAKEIIPLLISTYAATKKDHDILTVLMLLMKENRYGPFISSASFKKLYGEEDNYQSYISFNTANEELIIKRATDFYNESSR